MHKNVNHGIKCKVAEQGPSTVSAVGAVAAIGMMKAMQLAGGSDYLDAALEPDQAYRP